ncbi:hypothetical protein M3J07_008125 [Ascochyta lentis]
MTCMQDRRVITHFLEAVRARYMQNISRTKAHESVQTLEVTDSQILHRFVIVQCSRNAFVDS